MTIATYAELVSAVTDWLDLGDTVSDARVGTFIQLAEARLNRLLDDPEMETRTTATGTGQYTALPDDFKHMIGVSTGNDYKLQQVSGSVITSLDQTSTGTPRYYAIVDGAITFAPIDAAANITMLYERRLPALTEDADTNWLLTLAPDVYLYGALVQAEGFIAEDDRIAGWKAMFDEAVEELRQDAAKRRWGSAPLAPRLGRS